MRHLLLASAGGAIGAGLRHLVNVGLLRALGAGFPWWTLFANATGSLAMGLVVGWLLPKGAAGTDLRVFLATGILGGYTTFSAFSLDAVTLWRAGAGTAALLYVAASVALSIGGLVVGLWLARSA